MAVADQVLSIYAGVNGFLDDVPLDKIRQFEEELLRYAAEHQPQMKKDLVAKPKIDEAVGGQLKQIITEFKGKMGYGASS